MDWKSTYQILGIPDTVSGILFTLALILVLSPYASGVDLGVVKIPAFGDKTKRWLKGIGPLSLILTIGLFVPVWSTKEKPSFSPPAQLHILPPDLIIRATESHDRRRRIFIDVPVQALSGSLGLTREAKLISQQIDNRFFVSDILVPEVKLISATPSAPVVSASSSPATLRLEFDCSALVIRAQYIANHEDYIGQQCGQVSVEVSYKDGQALKTASFPIVLRFGE